jgi:hypothetical protein
MHHDGVPPSQFDMSRFALQYPKPWQSRNDTFVISRVNRGAEGSAEEHILEFFKFTLRSTVHVVVLSLRLQYATRHYYNVKASSNFRILESRDPTKSCQLFVNREATEAVGTQKVKCFRLPCAAQRWPFITNSTTRRTHHTSPLLTT